MIVVKQASYYFSPFFNSVEFSLGAFLRQSRKPTDFEAARRSYSPIETIINFIVDVDVIRTRPHA